VTKRYLVTGAAGFIGSRVTEMLLESGAAVVGIDNLNESYDVRIKEWRLSRLESRDGFEFRKLHLSDRPGIREVLSGHIDAVFNLAARAGVRASVEEPHDFIESNVTGVLTLLELCKDFGVKKFIQSSTSSVYGNVEELPVSEKARTEQPLSPYAASKLAAESLCYVYHHLYGISTTVFRYFNVYGPAGRPDNSLFRFILWISEGRPVQLFGDGTQSRDFTYVDDTVRGTVAGLDLPGYEVINLGSSSPVRIEDLISIVEGIAGREAVIEHLPASPSDPMTTWADVSKAKRLLGWSPESNIEDGVARAVEWYRENREWASTVRTD